MTDATAVAAIAEQILLARDRETGLHVGRVGLLARLIAEDTAAHFGLAAAEVNQIGTFAPVHDLGKVGVSDAILLKPGRLSADERVQVQLHVAGGLALLNTLFTQCQLHDPPALIRDLVALHHERLDGSGYPNGLTGDAISPAGRIIAVADVFDALTSARPYRRSSSAAEALQQLTAMVDQGELDAACVQALRHRWDRVCAVVGCPPPAI